MCVCVCVTRQARDVLLHYNTVLFLTDADPVAADGPPESWRVLAFPFQDTAVTLRHSTVLTWLPWAMPHFQTAPAHEVGFKLVTLSAQLQAHPRVVHTEGRLASAQATVQAVRAGLAPEGSMPTVLGSAVSALVAQRVLLA